MCGKKEGIIIGVWCEVGDVMLRGGEGVVKVCLNALEEEEREEDEWVV